MVGVAQLVEHWVVAPVVAGSSPVTHPINFPSRYHWNIKTPDTIPIPPYITQMRYFDNLFKKIYNYHDVLNLERIPHA